MKNKKVQFIVLFSILFSNVFFGALDATAAFNKQINYQGKLTNSSGVAVANGDYNMEFKLMTVSTGGDVTQGSCTTSCAWMETRTGANKVTVTSGLFSVLLGEVTSLSGVDFNQTLYLAINIGGTGSPSWDGLMTPRKTLGAVPAAVVAESLSGATFAAPGPIGSGTASTGAFTTLDVSTKILSANGTAGAPAYSFTSDSDNGMYLTGANSLSISVGGGETIRMATDNTWFKTSFIYLGSGADVMLQREAAATLQLGIDGATPIAQLFKAMDGTGTNIAGSNLLIAGGRSTGSSAGGSLIFQTSPAGGAGAGVNALVTALTITSTGASTFASTVAASNLSGTNTGDQTITLTGDVTGSGTGSFATTIGSDKILESMLKSVNGPTDEYCLTKEDTTGDFEWQVCSGGGTVTATGGSLTSNAIVLGAGGVDTKVVTGITTNGTAQIVLGVNNTTLGTLKMFGNTSGDVTLQPTAAAGTATTQTLPATSGTLVNRVTTANGVSASNSDGALSFTLGAITPTTVNGNTFTTGSYTLTGTAGKTLNFTNSLTLSGTDSTVMTFPSTSATIARTDAGQTFTGVNIFTAPRIITNISDTNGNELIVFTATGSAVNEWTLANGSTGVNPKLTASGETNVGLDFQTKGTGVFQFLATASGPTDIRLFEDTDNGTNYASLIAPATLGSDIVLTLPSASGTFATLAGTESLTNKKLGSLTTNGFVKTSGGDGTLSVDTSTYLTGNQSITISGDVSGTGTTAITTTIGSDKILESMLKSVNGSTDEYCLTKEDTTGDFEWQVCSGGGTVTATGGSLTSNAIVLGAGGVDTKVVTGITTNGTAQIVLGVNTTTLGTLKMFGNTSGDVTLQPTAVAGTATTQTLPATSGTLVNRVTTANGVSASNSDGALSFTLGAITPTTVNGNTFTTGSYTLTGTAGKTLNFTNSLTLSGTDSTVMTFPSTSATIARTDAANTFSGTQTFSGLINANLGLTLAANQNLTMSSGTGVFTQTYTGTANAYDLTSSSTTSANKAINVSQTGATSGTDYAGYFSNTGAATTNVGLYSTATGATNNYAAIFDAGSVGMGVTSSLIGKLHVVGSTTLSGVTAVAGIFTDLTLTNGTASGFEYGNRNLVTVNGGTAGTNVGQFIRMTDSTSLDTGQVVRGLEVQAFSGTNVNGTNTGIATYGYTFGMQAFTTAQAAAQAAPAAIFADLDNGTDATTKARGNAIRAYTDNATSATLVQLYQETSAYTGTGLQMNFGNNSGSFIGTFLDMQYQSGSKYGITYSSSTSKLTETYGATGSIIDYASGTNGNNFVWKVPQKATTGTCASAAAEGIIFQNTGGTQVGHLCIDGPTSGTPNKLRFYAEQFNATSTDLAENYSDADDSLRAGDVVTVDPNHRFGVTKTVDSYQQSMLGVVSTAPGVLLSGISESDGESELINPKPVALSGRVPVKVSYENGNIKAGDLLTSSGTMPGYAMKMTQPGNSIGVALEDSDSEKDTVVIFINLGYKVVPIILVEGENSESLSTEDNGLLTSLGGYISEFFTSVLEKVKDGVAYVKGIVTGKLTVGSSTKRTGITLYDEVTGDAYCLSIANGKQKTTEGECKIIEEDSIGSDEPIPESEPTPEPTQESESEVVPELESIPNAGEIPDTEEETDSSAESSEPLTTEPEPEIISETTPEPDTSPSDSEPSAPEPEPQAEVSQPSAEESESSPSPEPTQ